ncbi:ATP-dependent DNA helicase Q-like 3 [Mycena venus]|uniref:DNA 3'-5' helicase n=1 Tax=Mycena venus TaxID=2733690 RepID=A0A8H6ZAR2_9AGAR|nr:ATP-dependent DNA helicase Q-like 3 [Mycena venus]
MSGKVKRRTNGKAPQERRTRAATKITPAQLEAIKEELKLLPGLIRTHYTKWIDGAKDFQLECMGGQKLGKEILLHTATGAGKTGIAAGPHLLPSSQGKVTLVVSPLLSLHHEQVATFKDEFGLKATAINSSNGGCTKDVMQKVVSGEWQIVMLSPEMLLLRRFVDGVLRKSEFSSRCLSVFIDEAHCISHWGASFRKKYASIGIIRAFLPRTTSIIAVTATLTPRVREDLVTKLQFDRNSYTYQTIGNDRANVSMVIRAMEHPANSYRDTDFIVPADNKTLADIKLTFLYTDDIKDGGQLVDHLNARVHPNYRDRGLVQPYNAGMSRQYRSYVMALFRAGVIRVLVCTDAAGMGCDLPDIELAVQWKSCNSCWDQAGRIGRNYMKALDIPTLPPPPTRQKQPPAIAQPLPHPPVPPNAAFDPTPSLPAATNPRKRRNVTQGTPDDDVAPPAIRPHINSLPPLAPQTLPLPLYGHYPAYSTYPSPQTPTGVWDPKSSIVLLGFAVTPWAAATFFSSPSLTRDGTISFYAASCPSHAISSSQATSISFFTTSMALQLWSTVHTGASVVELPAIQLFVAVLLHPSILPEFVPQLPTSSKSFHFRSP